MESAYLYKISITVSNQLPTAWCSSFTGSIQMLSFAIFDIGGGSNITVLCTQRTKGG